MYVFNSVGLAAPFATSTHGHLVGKLDQHY